MKYDLDAEYHLDHENQFADAEKTNHVMKTYRKFHPGDAKSTFADSISVLRHHPAVERINMSMFVKNKRVIADLHFMILIQKHAFIINDSICWYNRMWARKLHRIYKG